jgi:hypothetical protein
MMCQKLIFISHRTKEQSVGEMLLDFLSTTGIPRDAIKCSSLPGNDVKVKISSEVRDWIKHSVVNIAILSSDYYDSAYCLNEAGILWYLSEIPVIPIGLPEITHEKMIGFLNNDYKIRRLDSDDDIAYIYDTVQEALGVSVAKHSVINTETKKLKERYNRFCDDRVTHTAMAEEADESLTYLEEEDLWIDGYHEVHDRDGNVIEKGQYRNGKLVDGISYNIILKISKQKDIYEKPEPTKEEAGGFDGYDYDCWEIRNTEEPIALEDIKKEEWSYSDFGRYDLPFALLRSNRYIKGIGLEYFYVVDKKVKLEGKLIKPIFTNFRTFESVMAEKEPDELGYIKTGIRKYDEAESAEIEID